MMKYNFQNVPEIKQASLGIKGMLNNEYHAVQKIPISDIVPFPNHPFKVIDDEAMEQLAGSIQLHGDVITPITVRKLDEGTYQLISGHRRTHAAKKAGLTEISALIIECTDEEAVVQMVDANMQRPEILPSEKAFAYKMRLEAMKKRSGRPSKENSSQLATDFFKGRADTELGKEYGESKDNIHRYIRLTHLIPELLQAVDDKSISLIAAVELSYMTSEAQRLAYDKVKDGVKISIEQAKLMRACVKPPLTENDVERILSNRYEKPKPTPKKLVEQKTERHDKKFVNSISDISDIYDTIDTDSASDVNDTDNNIEVEQQSIAIPNETRQPKPGNVSDTVAGIASRITTPISGENRQMQLVKGYLQWALEVCRPDIRQYENEIMQAIEFIVLCKSPEEVIGRYIEKNK